MGLAPQIPPSPSPAWTVSTTGSRQQVQLTFVILGADCMHECPGYLLFIMQQPANMLKITLFLLRIQSHLVCVMRQNDVSVLLRPRGSNCFYLRPKPYPAVYSSYNSGKILRAGFPRRLLLEHPVRQVYELIFSYLLYWSPLETPIRLH